MMAFYTLLGRGFSFISIFRKRKSPLPRCVLIFCCARHNASTPNSALCLQKYSSSSLFLFINMNFFSMFTFVISKQKDLSHVYLVEFASLFYILCSFERLHMFQILNTFFEKLHYKTYTCIYEIYHFHFNLFSFNF